MDHAARIKTALWIGRIQRWVLLPLGGVLLALSFFGTPHIPYIDGWHARRIADQLSERYGLVIRYGDPAEFYVPPLPPVADAPEKGRYMERTEVRFALTALKGVRIALAKYPPELIRKYLDAVFISGVIKIHGVQGGGRLISIHGYICRLLGISPRSASA